MRNKNPVLLLAGLLLAAASGCSHTQPVTAKPTILPPAAKAPQRAALVLDQDFGDFKFERSNTGEKWTFVLGPALKDYARRVTEASFQEIRVSSSPQEATREGNIDLILVPRALKADYAGAFVGTLKTQTDFMIQVEWVAKDRAGQTNLWRKTINASATDVAGTARAAGKHFPILSQKTFDDLSLKTHTTFQESLIPRLKSKP